MPLTAAVDGTDVTEFCLKINWNPRFNLIDSGVIRVPMGTVAATVGISRLSLELNSTLVFDGPIWYQDAEGAPDSGYTEWTAYDDRIYLTKRLCKWDDGVQPDGGFNLINPSQVILDNITAPQILRAYIQNAIDDPDANGLTGGPVSAPLPLILGTVDTNGDDVTGLPMDWPMSIERMRQLLSSTGQLDQVLTPNGDGTSTLDLLNDYNNDVSGTVSFDYGTGSFNSQIGTFTVDMEVMVDALWYLLGPRCTKQRWRGSITPSAPHPTGNWPVALAGRWNTARTSYGYFQEIRIFDDEEGECDDPMAGANAVRELFEEEYANEAWIRAVPRQFVSVRPERGIAPTNFRVGDLIGVTTGAMLDGGFTGAQMVYGFDLSTDFDGVDEIEEIVTSADQSGAPGA